jgi:hypothetical protein
MSIIFVDVGYRLFFDFQRFRCRFFCNRDFGYFVRRAGSRTVSGSCADQVTGAFNYIKISIFYFWGPLEHWGLCAC